MAGSPGTTGSTWNPDSCWVTATTAQMLRAVGRTSSASKAANMSMAQSSRCATVAGMRSRISARARSGSTGGSRGGAELQAPSSMAPRARIKHRVVTDATVADLNPWARVPLAAWALAEMHDAMLVVDRHFIGSGEYVHADEQGGLILQAPEIEDVEVADIRVHAVDTGLAEAQPRRPDAARKHQGAPESKRATVVILDIPGGDAEQRLAKMLVGERDVGARVDQHVDVHAHDLARDHQQR